MGGEGVPGFKHMQLFSGVLSFWALLTQDPLHVYQVSGFAFIWECLSALNGMMDGKTNSHELLYTIQI